MDSKWLLRALVIIGLCHSVSALVVTNATKYVGMSFNTPRMRAVAKSWSETFQDISLVLSTRANVSNRLVLWLEEEKLEDDSGIGRAYESGAKGVIFISARRIAGLFIMTHPDQVKDYAGVNFPTFQISKQDGLQLEELICANNGSIQVTIDGNDTNVWEEYLRNIVNILLFNVLLGSFALITMAFAAAKFYQYTVINGLHWSVCQVCLSMEIFANFVRAFYLFIDPVFTRLIFPDILANILLSITFPFMLLTTVLIGLYWQELSRRQSVAILVFIKRMKIPFYIVFCTLLLFDIVSASMRSIVQSIGEQMVFAASSIYLILTILIVIFFLWAGSAILSKLEVPSDSQSKQNRRLKRLRLVTILIMSSAIFQVVPIVAVAITLSTGLIWEYPELYTTSWFVFYFCIIATSFIQIMAWGTSRKKGGSTRNTSSYISTTQRATGVADASNFNNNNTSGTVTSIPVDDETKTVNGEDEKESVDSLENC